MSCVIPYCFRMTLHMQYIVVFVTGNCDVERVRYCRECTGQACEAIPATDLWYDSVASEQQVGQSASAGCRSHLKDCYRHENLPGGLYSLPPKHLVLLPPCCPNLYVSA